MECSLTISCLKQIDLSVSVRSSIGWGLSLFCNLGEVWMVSVAARERIKKMCDLIS